VIQLLNLSCQDLSCKKYKKKNVEKERKKGKDRRREPFLEFWNITRERKWCRKNDRK
jgi:hypothetical protein